MRHGKTQNQQRVAGSVGASDSGIHTLAQGRRRTVDDRTALNGILYVRRTGIPWEELPQALGLGRGMTCWRRLRAWQAQGVWHRLPLAMLCRLCDHDQIDRERASLDGAGVSSARGLDPTEASIGSMRHIVVGARGIKAVRCFRGLLQG